MSAGEKGLVSKLGKHRSAFLVKSVILFGVLLLIGWFAPKMHPVPLAFLWAALSAVSALSLAYDSVIKKARNQHQYKSGSLFARLNSGRVLTLAIAFVVSAVCTAGLIVEAPKWEFAEWLLIALAVPLFLGVFELLKRFFAKQYEPLYQVSRSIKFSVIAVGVLLCLAYLIISSIGPTVSYSSLAEALSAAKTPFDDSPSVLLSEVGEYAAAADAVMAFGASEVAKGSMWVYLAIRVVVSASAFFGASGLVGSCMLEPADVRLVFMPLDSIKGARRDWGVRRRYVVVACALPIILVLFGLAANNAAADVVSSDQYKAAKKAIGDQFNTMACKVDGQLYDQAGLESLNEKFRSDMGRLYAQRKKELEPLINEAFKQRERNVDEYLDWYYSLPADYEMLIKYFTGSIESGMRDKFLETIEAGVDETAIFEKNEEFSEQAQGYLNELGKKLEECKIADRWEWLFGGEAASGKADPDMSVEPDELKSTVGERMRLPSIVFPIGGYVLLKVDEAMNRDTYKKELLAPYEEKRDEMLKMVDIPEDYKSVVYGPVNTTISAVKLRAGLEHNTAPAG